MPRCGLDQAPGFALAFGNRPSGARHGAGVLGAWLPELPGSAQAATTDSPRIPGEVGTPARLVARWQVDRRDFARARDARRDHPTQCRQVPLPDALASTGSVGCARKLAGALLPIERKVRPHTRRGRGSRRVGEVPRGTHRCGCQRRFVVGNMRALPDRASSCRGVL